MSTLLSMLQFLIETICGLFMFLILLRFFLYRVNVNFREPLAQIIMRLTNPVLRPLHRNIPAWRRIDFAALLVLFTAMFIKIVLIFLLYNGLDFGIILDQLPIFLLLSLLSTINFILNFFFYSILIGVIASWIIQNHSYHFVLDFLYHVNELLLAPVRAYVQPIQGIDFSPLIVIIILKLLMIGLPG